MARPAPDPRASASGLFVLAAVAAVEAGLDQPRQSEADDGGAGQRNARALPDECAGVVDQFVGVLGSEAVGGILDRCRSLAGIIAIFLAEPLIEASGSV